MLSEFLQSKICYYEQRVSGIQPLTHLQSGPSLFVEKILSTFQEPITVLRPYPFVFSEKEDSLKAHQIRHIAMIALCCHDPKLSDAQKQKVLDYLLEKRLLGHRQFLSSIQLPSKVIFDLLHTYKARRIPKLIKLLERSTEITDIVVGVLTCWNTQQRLPKKIRHFLKEQGVVVHWNKKTPFDNELEVKKTIRKVIQKHKKRDRWNTPRSALYNENNPKRVFTALEKLSPLLRKDILGIASRRYLDNRELYTFYHWIYEHLKISDPIQPNEVFLQVAELLCGSKSIRTFLQNPGYSKPQIFLEIARGKKTNPWTHLAFWIDCLSPKEFFQMLEEASQKDLKDCLEAYLKQAKQLPLLWKSLMETLEWGANHNISASSRLNILSLWCTDHKVRCELLSNYPKDFATHFYDGRIKLSPLRREVVEDLCYSLTKDPDLFLAQIRLLFRDGDSSISKKEERDLKEQLLKKNILDATRAAWEGACASSKGPREFYRLLEEILLFPYEKSPSKEWALRSWLHHILLLWPEMNARHGSLAQGFLNKVPQEMLCEVFFEYGYREKYEQPLEARHLDFRFDTQLFLGFFEIQSPEKSALYERMSEMVSGLESSCVWERFLEQVRQLPTSQLVLFLRVLYGDQRNEMMDRLFPAGMDQEIFGELVETIFSTPVFPGSKLPMSFSSGIQLMFDLSRKVISGPLNTWTDPLLYAADLIQKQWHSPVTRRDLNKIKHRLMFQNGDFLICQTRSDPIEKEVSAEEGLHLLDKLGDENLQVLCARPVAIAYEAWLRDSDRSLSSKIDNSFWKDKLALFFACAPHFSEELISSIFPLYLEQKQKELLIEQIHHSHAGNKASFLLSLIPLKQRASYLVKRVITEKISSSKEFHFTLHQWTYDSLSNLVNQWMSWTPEAPLLSCSVPAAWDLFCHQIFQQASPPPFALALVLSRNGTEQGLIRDLSLAKKKGVSKELLLKSLSLAISHQLYTASLLDSQEAPGVGFLEALLRLSFHVEGFAIEKEASFQKLRIELLRKCCKEHPYGVMKWIKEEARKSFLEDSHRIARFVVENLPPREFIDLLDLGTYSDADLLICELKHCPLEIQEQIIRTVVIEAQSLYFPRELFAQLMIQLGRNKELRDRLKLEEWQKEGALSHLFPRDLLDNGHWMQFKASFELASKGGDREKQALSSFLDKDSFKKEERLFLFPSTSWVPFFEEACKNTPHRKDLVELAYLAHKYGTYDQESFLSFYNQLLRIPPQSPEFYLQLVGGRRRHLAKEDTPWFHFEHFPELMGAVLFRFLSRGISLPSEMEESPWLLQSVLKTKQLRKEFFSQTPEEQYELLFCWIRDQQASLGFNKVFNKLISSFSFEELMELLRSWDRKHLRKNWKEEKVYPFIHKQIKKCFPITFEIKDSWTLKILMFECGEWKSLLQGKSDEEQTALWESLSDEKEKKCASYSPMERALVEYVDQIQTPQQAENWIQVIQYSYSHKSDILDLGSLLDRKSKNLTPLVRLAGNSSLLILPPLFVSLLKGDIGGDVIDQLIDFALLKFRLLNDSGEERGQIQLLNWVRMLNKSRMIDHHLSFRKSLDAHDLRSRLQWNFNKSEKPNSILLPFSKALYETEIKNLEKIYWSHVHTQAFFGRKKRKGYDFLERCLCSLLHHRYEPTTLSAEEENPSPLYEELQEFDFMLSNLSEEKQWQCFAFLYLVCKDPQLEKTTKRLICQSKYPAWRASSFIYGMPAPVAIAALETLEDEERLKVIREATHFGVRSSSIDRWLSHCFLKKGSTKLISEIISFLSNESPWPIEKSLPSHIEEKTFRVRFWKQLKKASEKRVMRVFRSLLPQQMKELLEVGKKDFFFEKQRVKYMTQVFHWFLEALSLWEDPYRIPPSLNTLALVLWGGEEENFLPQKEREKLSIKAGRSLLLTRILKGEEGRWRLLPKLVFSLSKSEVLQFLLSCSQEDSKSALKELGSQLTSQSSRKWMIEFTIYCLQKTENNRTEKGKLLRSSLMGAWGTFDWMRSYFLYQATPEQRKLFRRNAGAPFLELEVRGANHVQKVTEKCLNFSLYSKHLENYPLTIKKILLQDLPKKSQEEQRKVRNFLATNPRSLSFAWETIVSLDPSANLFFDLAEEFLKDSQSFPHNSYDKIEKQRVDFLRALFFQWRKVSLANHDRAKQLIQLLKDEDVHNYVYDSYHRGLLERRSPYGRREKSDFPPDQGIRILDKRIKVKSFLPKDLKKCQKESAFRLILDLLETAKELRVDWDLLSSVHEWSVEEIALLLRMTPLSLHKIIVRRLNPHDNISGDEKIVALIDYLLTHSPLPGETLVTTLPIVNSIIQCLRSESSAFLFTKAISMIKKSKIFHEHIVRPMEEHTNLDIWEFLDDQASAFRSSIREVVKKGDVKDFKYFFSSESISIGSSRSEAPQPPLNRGKTLLEIAQAMFICPFITEQDLKQAADWYNEQVEKESEEKRKSSLFEGNSDDLLFVHPNLFIYYFKYLSLEAIKKIIGTTHYSFGNKETFKWNALFIWVKHESEKGEEKRIRKVLNLLTKEQQFSFLSYIAKVKKFEAGVVTQYSDALRVIHEETERTLSSWLNINLYDPQTTFLQSEKNLTSLFLKKLVDLKAPNPSQIALVLLRLGNQEEFFFFLKTLKDKKVEEMEIVTGLLLALRTPLQNLILMKGHSEWGNREYLLKNLGHFLYKTELVSLQNSLAERLSLDEWIEICCFSSQDLIQSGELNKLLNIQHEQSFSAINTSLSRTLKKYPYRFCDWIERCVGERFSELPAWIENFLHSLSSQEMKDFLSKARENTFEHTKRALFDDYNWGRTFLQDILCDSTAQEIEPRRFWKKIVGDFIFEFQWGSEIDFWNSFFTKISKKAASVLCGLYPHLLQQDNTINTLALLKQKELPHYQKLLSFAGKTLQDPVEVVALAYKSAKRFSENKQEVPFSFWKAVLKEKSLPPRTLFEALFCDDSLIGSFKALRSSLQEKVALRALHGLLQKKDPFHPNREVKEWIWNRIFSVNEKRAPWGKYFKKIPQADQVRLISVWIKEVEKPEVLVRLFTQSWNLKEKKKLEFALSEVTEILTVPLELIY